MSEYKSLPIQQDKIHDYVSKFVESHGLRIDDLTDEVNGSGKRVIRAVIGKQLIQSALIDFLCNNDGTTTIFFKQGKNQELGEKLAEFVKETIDPNEFESVEMSLQHLKEEDIHPILELVASDKYEDDLAMFILDEKQDSERVLQVEIKSVKHQDCLMFTFHRTTGTLQLQGKPLFVYKRLCYHFVDALNILGIEKILSRKDESRAEVVRQEVAEQMLEKTYPNVFEKAPPELKKLIVSGMCISLSTPTLPEYSMLTYPDLRALEGAIHNCLIAYGLYSSNYSDDGKARVGCMFYLDSKTQTYSLKSEHVNNIGCGEMVKALEDGYNQYSGKRHSLFHIEEELVFTMFIRDISIAMNIIHDTRNCIEELYRIRPQ